MFPVFVSEVQKLRRSSVAFVAAGAPIIVAFVGALILLSQDVPSRWEGITEDLADIWGMFMLPMSVTGICLLIAQIEHGPNSWNHLLTMPVARWRFFAAKALLAIALVAAMSIMLFLLIPLSGVAAEAVGAGTQIVGTVPWWSLASLLGKLLLGSFLMIAIQLWAALRFKSFTTPLVLGIGGTFSSILAMMWGKTFYLPWMLPLIALSEDPGQAAMALLLGIAGGVSLGLLMVLDLGKREFA